MEKEEKDNEIDWGSLMRRKDRPLPKKGCSWLFYAVLLLLTAYLITMYVRYKGL